LKPATKILNKKIKMNKKTALICGVSGQDGSFLAKFLLEKGYMVYGTSRDAQGSSFGNLGLLGIKDQIKYLSMVPEDFHSVLVALRKSDPDEIYYLAGQSSVGLSFEQPSETIQSFTLGTLNLLEALRMLEKPARFYNAGSSESFGDTKSSPANELTPFNPMSPYAVAKGSATWLVRNYRDAYGVFACTGILFNHESSLRPERFVTQKIIRTVKRIASGSSEKLTLGRMDISRDWGWAPEFVEAMWLMLQQNKPSDYVIATGCSISLEDFVQAAFNQAGLDWKSYVVQDSKLLRPNDLKVSSADPRKALIDLGWKASTKGVQVVQKMYQSD
jgi:GDPmannose 4,6-dehydratase